VFHDIIVTVVMFMPNRRGFGTASKGWSRLLL
jgi:hypothetical protein